MVEDPRWTRRRFLGASAAGAAGLVLAGCHLDNGSSTDGTATNKHASFGGTLVSPPLGVPDVTLTTMDGDPFPFRERIPGKLTLLFFGYTNCPDQCPVYLSSLARARASVATGPGSRPQVLFVGVDRERDTPARLREYMASFDDTFIGLTGSARDIARANDSFHFPAIEITEPDADGQYEVFHYAKGIAFTPDGKGRRLYGFDVRQAQFAKDLPRLARGHYS